MDNDVVQGTRTNPAYIQYMANMDRPRIFFNKLFANFISMLWPKNKSLSKNKHVLAKGGHHEQNAVMNRNDIT